MQERGNEAEEVLRFWFGEPAKDAGEVLTKVKRWFQGGAGFDAEVKERFTGTVEAALSGALDGWAATARGRLALVIVLDQLTRNVFRGDARTYEGDAVAQRLAVEAFDRGIDRELGFVERMFLSMPLLHAEDLALQERVGEIAARSGEESPPEYAQMSRMHREQTAKYTDVIRRFGRFPHRNELLGRESTPAELEFLRDWAERAPPTGVRSPS